MPLQIAAFSVVALMSAPFTFACAASRHRWIVDGARSAYRRFTMLVARVNWISGVTTALHELGPYAAIALLLPGGTVTVASLWILQHRPWLFAHVQRSLAIVLALRISKVIDISTASTG